MGSRCVRYGWAACEVWVDGWMGGFKAWVGLRHGWMGGFQSWFH